MSKINPGGENLLRSKGSHSFLSFSARGGTRFVWEERGGDDMNMGES